MPQQSNWLSGSGPEIPLPPAADRVKSGSRRLWWWVLSTVLSAVLVYLACRGIEWRRVLRIIAVARSPYLFAAAATTCCSYFLRSLRWRILLNAEGRFAVGTVFWANMAGYLGNNFLPARAGELVRTVIISGQSRLTKTYVLTTAISERLMDVIFLVLVSSLVLLGIQPKPHWMEEISRATATGAALAAAAFIVIPYTGGLPALLVGKIPLPPALSARLIHFTEQVVLGMKVFHHWPRFIGFFLFTIAIWSADASAAMIAARALGLPLSFPVAFLLLTALGLGSALPSTPGYVGVYQFAAVTVLTPFGFSRDAALAYILVMQALGYAVVLALGLPGLYWLRRIPGSRLTAR
jgi:uncharacterized protein (TIRG00374 family)